MIKKDLQISSKRQWVRLWFECYKILIDPKNKPYFSKPSKYWSEMFWTKKGPYKNWGSDYEILRMDFSEWWEEKKHLFDDQIPSVRQISMDTFKHPDFDPIMVNQNTININVPLNQPISKSLNEVKKILEKNKQRNFNVEYTSNFKGVFRHINLEIYKIYLELKKPPINRKFLIEIRKDFDSRPRSRIKDSNYLNLPTMKMFETRYTTNGDVEDIVRSVRRGIKEVEKTLLNVCQGKFP